MPVVEFTDSPRRTYRQEQRRSWELEKPHILMDAGLSNG